jgi:hypothetical protein
MSKRLEKLMPEIAKQQQQGLLQQANNPMM